MIITREKWPEVIFLCRKFSIDLSDLFLAVHQKDVKTSVDITLDNMTLSEIKIEGNKETQIELLKFLSFNPKQKPQPLRCFIEKIIREGNENSMKIL